MITKNYPEKKKLVEQLLKTTPQVTRGSLVHITEEILAQRDKFLKLVSTYPTPFYAFDSEALQLSIKQYVDSFAKAIPNATHFYAVKVNHYDEVLKRVFQSGFGADVSSARELDIALKAGAQKVVFSGPGKTLDELKRALEHRDIVTINIDSFGELKKLGDLSKSSGTKVRAGVRVSFKEHGSWGKFGIPLSECNRFFDEAEKYSAIDLAGIQFHISWNADAEPYVVAIKNLAEYLRTSLDPRHLSKIKFIDIGGGFRPFNSEGYYPEDTPLGSAILGACEAFDEDPEFSDRYFLTEALPINAYALRIGEAIDTYLRPILNCEYYTEPGRVICNSSLHVVLQVEDVKSPDCIILNGGTNIVGFERFEFDYFPLINLTHPSQVEIPCMVYGSLCMPQDYWGQYIYASKVSEGDVIVVPYQGALTYANMQDFIKGRVSVHTL